MLKGNEKILIVKPSSLGDIIHSVAFLNALKENFPETVVHWIVAKEFEDLITKHPLIDKVITVDKSKWKKVSNLIDTIKAFSHLSAELKKEKYQITFDLQGLLRSGIITWLSNAPLKIGFKEARELSPFFYNKKISASVELHAVLRYLEIAKAIGCKINSIRFPLPPHKPPVWLKDYENYIVLIPSARWQSKNWPLPYYVELVKMFDNPFLIVGSSSDEDLAKRIEEYSQGKAKSVAGRTTLKELIGVFKKSLFVITPDTGTMHLAVASGKRVVALFGSTSANRTGPFGEGHIIIKSEKPCSPCFKKFCPTQDCMKEITPKKVYDIITEKWEELCSIKKGRQEEYL